MRHKKDCRKLGMNSAHRKAVIKNLMTALLRYEHIETTLPKAKAVRRYAEKAITLGKKGTLASKRQIFRQISDKQVTKKLFTVLGERYAQRNGGYTRIIKTGYRRGDNAPMAVIELIDRGNASVSAAPKDKKEEKTKTKTPAKIKAAKKIKKEEKVAVGA